MAKLQLHIVTWLVGPVKCYNFLERKKFYKLCCFTTKISLTHNLYLVGTLEQLSKHVKLIKYI